MNACGFRRLRWRCELVASFLAQPHLHGVSYIMGLRTRREDLCIPPPLTQPPFSLPDSAFPNDRRFAFLDLSKSPPFNPLNPAFIHKSSFLCSFTARQLLKDYKTTFDDVTGDLTVYGKCDKGTALFSSCLTSDKGRYKAEVFFSSLSSFDLLLVSSSSPTHTHQFGNTSSGVKRNNDTRTIHIVNAATVREVSKRCGVSLEPKRFRGNVVIDGVEPWGEFDWVGKVVKVGGVDMEVLSRTIRCDGVSDKEDGVDLPKMLAEEFPEHGPYLGVYAQVRKGGRIEIGDNVTW